MAKDGDKRPLAKLRRLKEKIHPSSKLSKKGAGKKRQKALKLWDKSFGGGFCYSMKVTADFLKEKKQKAKEKKEKRRLKRFAV